MSVDFLQEHWLFTDQLHLLSFHDDFFSFGMSRMDLTGPSIWWLCIYL